jgi:radical SAM superfamily enzyme YgiQ (UPF0313 family)
MKLLLINPVTRESDAAKYFPLGLGLIAAIVRRLGHEVEALDLNATRPTPEEEERLLAAASADVFGLTGLITDLAVVRRLTRSLRAAHPDAPILLGGGLASSFPEIALGQTAANIVLPGEADLTIGPLLEALAAGGEWRALPGLVYRERERFVRTATAPVVTNLDDLPFPDRELSPAEIYAENMRQAWMFGRPTRGLSVITSRGCPYRCIYCDKSIWGERFRQRSVDNVVAEIETLASRFSLEGVLFADDTFVLRREWVRGFCRELRARMPGLRWSANGRVGRLDDELLDEMAAAGCDTLGFGFESGSDLILRELRKNVTAAQALATTQAAQRAGIRVIGYITVGSFSETAETIEETVGFLKAAGVPAGVNFLTPFPGTPLYDEARRRGKLSLPPEAMLERWGAWQETLLVNLTDLPDAELARLKRRVARYAGGKDRSPASMAFTLSAEEQQEAWAGAIRRIAAAGCERFCILGAGAHTRRLLTWLAGRNGPAPVAVIDQDPAKTGVELPGGLRVAAALPGDADSAAVLLSSDAYEDQMWDSARRLFPPTARIFRIYGD